MEKLTISQAMIKLSDLEKSYHQKMYLLQQVDNNTIMYILELDDKKYFCNEPFDFEKVFNMEAIEFFAYVAYCRFKAERERKKIEALNKRLIV